VSGQGEPKREEILRLEASRVDQQVDSGTAIEVPLSEVTVVSPQRGSSQQERPLVVTFVEPVVRNQVEHRIARPSADPIRGGRVARVEGVADCVHKPDRCDPGRKARYNWAIQICQDFAHRSEYGLAREWLALLRKQLIESRTGIRTKRDSQVLDRRFGLVRVVREVIERGERGDHLLEGHVGRE
jgi:hypothetical protein